MADKILVPDACTDAIELGYILAILDNLLVPVVSNEVMLLG